MTFVARGEVPLGIVYTTDAQIDKKVRIVDTFPENTPRPDHLPGRSHRYGARRDAAAFLAFLRSNEAAPSGRNTDSWSSRNEVRRIPCAPPCASPLRLAIAPAFADDAALKAEVDALRAAISRATRPARCAGQAAAKHSRRNSRRSRSSSASRKSRRPKRRKSPLQEAPKLTFTNNRPTITAADGRSSIRGSRQRAARRRACTARTRKVRSTTDFRRGSVGGTANRENNAARDFSDGFYFRARAFRRRRHHRARLQLPTAARARRHRHRRSDAHQRRLDRLHRLRAVHVAARRILAARQHGRRHLARRSGVPRTRQRFGTVALAGRRRWPHRPRRSRPMARAG